MVLKRDQKKRGDTWLTLGELAYLAHLNIATVRSFLKRFGEVITGCEFDDTAKFPPETPGIMMAIAALCREGLSTQEIVDLFREIQGEGGDDSDPSRSAYIKLVRALLMMVDSQNLALRHMIQVMEKITLMLPEVAACIENLAASDPDPPLPWLTAPPWNGCRK